MKPLIVQSGEGEVLHAFGEINSIMLTGEQTGGNLTIMFDTTPPGLGPPLHRHSNEDEIFLVANGCINYNVEGKWTEVGPGGLVYLPKGTVHRYQNVGDTPSSHWIITNPSGFETFFKRCADEFANEGGPDMDRIEEISEDHGIEFIKAE